MSNKYQKTSPVALDEAVQYLQDYIYSALADYGVTDHESYGLCYRNETAAGNIPEWTANGKDYTDVRFDDKHDITTFFISGQGSEIVNQAIANADVFFVVQCKLDKIFPSITHRADQELQNLLSYYINNNPRGHEFTNIITGRSNAYDKLEFEKDSFDDIGSHHVVAFKLNIEYHFSCPNNY